MGDLNKKESRECVVDALNMLVRMAHRGACGCEENTGDGAGILVAIPHAFYASTMAKKGITLPEPGGYAVGMLFLPRDPDLRFKAKADLDRVANQLGHTVLGWRAVPTNNAEVGPSARSTEPVVEQVFLTPSKSESPLASAGPGDAAAAGEREKLGVTQALDFEQQLWVLRKYTMREVKKRGLTEEDFYVCSLSSATVVYKGQLTPEQVSKRERARGGWGGVGGREKRGNLNGRKEGGRNFRGLLFESLPRVGPCVLFCRR